jgi:hypothetical protein
MVVRSHFDRRSYTNPIILILGLAVLVVVGWQEVKLVLIHILIEPSHPSQIVLKLVVHHFVPHLVALRLVVLIRS